MKKLRLFAVIFAIGVVIFGSFSNNVVVRLGAATVIAIFVLKGFHILYRHIFIYPTLQVYNIFVSHSWSYSDAYRNLVALLRKDNSARFIDHSVPKESPIHNAPNSKELYQAIKEKMTPCQVVIVLVGVYASYSTWINNEVYIAKREFVPPKPILAVTPRGARRISDQVSQHADMVVKWNTKSVTDAIRYLVNQRTK